jgi:light-regulated signal transduction histidine kinase (bacteriophytochrome)
MASVGVRRGEAFAVGMESIRPGSTAILRMERPSGTLKLKVAVTELALGGIRYLLISLQNIESEMSAQEMVAWQTVIRVMAHEVMNSLTPVSSLLATAHDLVSGVIKQLPADDPRAAALTDAAEALETVTRRSQGLLHFVQNHRRLTKHLVTQIEVAPVQRIFARLQRLLANDLAARDIHDDECRGTRSRHSATLLPVSSLCLPTVIRTVAWPLWSRTTVQVLRRISVKIFVPFFTTKRQGCGVGLTLVRQIATAHAATVDVSSAPGGGATVSLRF